MDNVDQTLITALRSSVAESRHDINVTYDVVLADSPNVIEYGSISFRIADVPNISLATIALDLSFHSGFLNAAFHVG